MIGELTSQLYAANQDRDEAQRKQVSYLNKMKKSRNQANHADPRTLAADAARNVELTAELRDCSSRYEMGQYSASADTIFCGDPPQREYSPISFPFCKTPTPQFTIDFSKCGTEF